MEITFEVNTQATYLEDAATKKRKSLSLGKLEDGSSPRKRKPGPPPRTIPRAALPRKAPTRLRKDRPVRTGLPMDIWETILGFCTLEKLLKLRRLSGTFYSALQSDSTWKQARIHQFGPDQPDPPDYLTEMQYADLLVGVGCHGAGCNEKCTRRTYWAFRRRWCEKCCVLNLVKGRLAKAEYDRYDEISKCVPHAMYDSWNHYQWAGHYEEPPPWAGAYGAQSRVYSKFDLQEFDCRLKRVSPIPDDSTWLEEQEASNAAYLIQLQKIETWVELDRKQREKERADMRDKRADFFEERAALLEPPLEFEALKRCPSYDRSIRISKLPTEKSWQMLQVKLTCERGRAEAENTKSKRAKYQHNYRFFLARNYEDIIEKRKNMCTPEQLLVLCLADKVIQDVLAEPAGVHDSDLVNVILRGVYEAYQKIDDTAKPTNAYGAYRLIMDDARHVYRRRILPLISSFSFKRHSTARLLKCPALCSNLYQFEDLMEHLQAQPTHAKGFEYSSLAWHPAGMTRAALSWYCLEWPRNLPMLARHQTNSSDWDIDAEPNYIPATPSQIVSEESINTFIDRHAESPAEPGMVFTESILHAANQLRYVLLGKDYKSIVALEFARRLHLGMHDAPLASKNVHQIEETLNATSLDEVFDDHRCYRCQSNHNYSAFSVSPHSFVAMARHYIVEHGETESWSQSMLALPNADHVKGMLFFANAGAITKAVCELFADVKPSPAPGHSSFYLGN